MSRCSLLCPAGATLLKHSRNKGSFRAARERRTLHCVCRARWLNWRLDVFSLLVLLLAVLPFYHCYRGLATTGSYCLARLLPLLHCLATALVAFQGARSQPLCLAHAPSSLSSAENSVHNPLDQPSLLGGTA